MPYNLFISIANMENVSYPVMNLTHYTLNMSTYSECCVKHTSTYYAFKEGKWPILKYFRKEGFSIATYIVRRCSIHFLKYNVYQTYRKPSPGLTILHLLIPAR